MLYGGNGLHSAAVSGSTAVLLAQQPYGCKIEGRGVRLSEPYA